MDLVKQGARTLSAMFILVVSIAASASEPLRSPGCGMNQWQPFIDEASDRFSLRREYIRAVLRAESAGCTEMNGKPTVSGAGALGLMQLMPRTWREQRKRLGLGDDPHDPRDNILAGAAYLGELVRRYGWPGAGAAYHAGPTRYDEYLTSGRPLPPATLEYVARIERSVPNHASDSPPDVGERLSASTFATSPNTSPRAGLFVPLRQSSRQTNSRPQESQDVQKR